MFTASGGQLTRGTALLVNATEMPTFAFGGAFFGLHANLTILS